MKVDIERAARREYYIIQSLPEDYTQEQLDDSEPLFSFSFDSPENAAEVCAKLGWEIARVIE